MYTIRVEYFEQFCWGDPSFQADGEAKYTKVSICPENYNELIACHLKIHEDAYTNKMNYWAKFVPQESLSIPLE